MREGHFLFLGGETLAGSRLARWIIWMIAFMAIGAALLLGERHQAYAFSGSGDGLTAETAYIITNAAQLDEVRHDLDAYYRLEADIDLAGFADWEPIGYGGLGPFFTGAFDGNGHTIANLTIDSTANNVGLFGTVMNAEIRNVGLINVNVKGTDEVGGLIGYVGDSTVENAYATGTVTGNDGVGGLIGHAMAGNSSPKEITNVYAAVDANGSSNVGGLIGKLEGPVTVVNGYYDMTLEPGSTIGVGLSTAEMMTSAGLNGFEFSPGGEGHWGLFEGESYPMHRSKYDQLLLDSLSVSQGSPAGPVELTPAFANDHTAYAGRVRGDVTSIEVAASPKSGSSATVSINGNSAAETVTLIPGANTVTISVYTANAAVPGSLADPFVVDYSLDIVRENGSSTYPHRISSAEELAAIGTGVFWLNGYYELTRDLDLSGYPNWDPIGDEGASFTGQFEGGHHVIRHLNVMRESENAVGLFAFNEGLIQNIGIENANVSGRGHVGALIGKNGGTVSNVYARGTVIGGDQVGGLIGTNGGNVSLAYYAGTVTGDGLKGGLIGSQTAGSATDSFWDTEASGLIASGGGTGLTTAEMQLRETYEDSGWDFTGVWAILNGSAYPTWKMSLDKVKLTDLAVTPSVGTGAWDAAFSADQGAYTITLDRYVTEVEVAAEPADAGASVAIASTTGTTATKEVTPGHNEILVEVTSSDGTTKGAYLLNVEVPAPALIGITAPADGDHGVGATLTFIASYEDDVSVAGTPRLPLLIGAGTGYADYAGQPPGALHQLRFEYIVPAGIVDWDGIGLGTAIELPAGASVTAAGEAAALGFAAPDVSGIRLDAAAPSIALAQTPGSGTPTVGKVTVGVTLSDDGSGVVEAKWAAGAQSAAFFSGGGTALAGSSFDVGENGSYTVYARDTVGNEAVKTIAIANIRKPAEPDSGGGSTDSPAESSPAYTVSLSEDGGITVRIPALMIAKTTREDGTVIETAAMTEEMMEAVLDKLGEAKQPVVTVEIEDRENAAQLAFPAGSFSAWRAAFPDASVVVKLRGSSMQLPVAMLQLDELAATWGVKLQDLHVNVTMSRVGGEAESRLAQAAGRQGMKQVGHAVDYRITVSAGERTDELADFNGRYLTQSILLDEVPAEAVVTAVWFDSVSRTMHYVPGLIKERKDGHPEMVMRVPHNSIYAVMAASGKTFADMEGHWARSAVERLAAMLVVSGVTESRFAPEANITRAEFTALLVRSLGLEAGRPASGTLFRDVGAKAWYAQAVEAAVEAGLAQGVDAEHFTPNAPITREQMASMLVQAIRFTGKELSAIDAGRTLSAYADADAVSAWATTSVAQAVDAGILNGFPGRAIAPASMATRAQAVAMLQSFLQYVGFIDGDAGTR